MGIPVGFMCGVQLLARRQLLNAATTMEEGQILPERLMIATAVQKSTIPPPHQPAGEAACWIDILFKRACALANVRYWPRRAGSVRLAQEAEGASCRLIKKVNCV
jgi:hypothetical protein